MISVGRVEQRALMIGISAVYDESRVNKRISRIQIFMNSCFDEHVKSDYFESIRSLSIMLYVLASPALVDFGPLGIGKVKHRKSDKELEISVILNSEQFENLEMAELHHKLVEIVRECVSKIKERAKKLKELKDADAYDREFEAALNCFAGFDK